MKNVGRLTSHSYELKAGSIAHNGGGLAPVLELAALSPGIGEDAMIGPVWG